jgi:hypothetical protein
VSLIKKLFVNEGKLAANQANGRQSRVPPTGEGLERIRAANTRRGYHSQAKDGSPQGDCEAAKSSEYPTISLKLNGLKINFGDIPRCH